MDENISSLFGKLIFQVDSFISSLPQHDNLLCISVLTPNYLSEDSKSMYIFKVLSFHVLCSCPWGLSIDCASLSFAPYSLFMLATSCFSTVLIYYGGAGCRLSYLGSYLWRKGLFPPAVDRLPLPLSSLPPAHSLCPEVFIIIHG